MTMKEIPMFARLKTNMKPTEKPHDSVINVAGIKHYEVKHVPEAGRDLLVIEMEMDPPHKMTLYAHYTIEEFEYIVFGKPKPKVSRGRASRAEVERHVSTARVLRDGCIR